MLISSNLHEKGSEVSIKTKSTPASLSYKGQGTKHTTVKWSIICELCGICRDWRSSLAALSFQRRNLTLFNLMLPLI